MKINKWMAMILVVMGLGINSCSKYCCYSGQIVEEEGLRDSAGFVTAELIPDPFLYYAGCNRHALYKCCNDVNRAENALYLMIGYWHWEDKNPHEVVIHADSIRLRMRNKPEQLLIDPEVSNTHNWYARGLWHAAVYPIVIPCDYKDTVYINMNLKIMGDDNRIVCNGPITIRAILHKRHYTIFDTIKYMSQDIVNKLLP